VTRYKPVPPARTLAGLATVQAALPLVPGGVEDCCRRLQERAEVSSRERARDWLPFLVALGLAREDGGAYYRSRAEPERETVAGRFREQVLGVREVLEALAAGPLSPGEAFVATSEIVPRWERGRDPQWRATWRARTGRLLAWAAAFGLARRVADSNCYRLVE